MKNTPQLKLEIGKCYRTRDGQKVTLTMYYPEDSFSFCGYIDSEHDTLTWMEDGRFMSPSADDDTDIIAPWEEEPCQATRQTTDNSKDALRGQVGGDHYKDMPIQPVEFCQRNGLNYCESNVVKYVCRHRAKNGRQDIEKAIHYLQLLLELEYPQSGQDQTRRAKD